MPVDSAAALNHGAVNDHACINLCFGEPEPSQPAPREGVRRRQAAADVAQYQAADHGAGAGADALRPSRASTMARSPPSISRCSRRCCGASTTRSPGFAFRPTRQSRRRRGCARSTVAEAIKALEEAGLLTWVNRIKRVHERVVNLFGEGVHGQRSRVFRTSNGYQFIEPPDVQSSKSENKSGTEGQESFPFLGNDLCQH